VQRKTPVAARPRRWWVLRLLIAVLFASSSLTLCGIETHGKGSAPTKSQVTQFV
jgi:hypothetical protein